VCRPVDVVVLEDDDRCRSAQDVALLAPVGSRPGDDASLLAHDRCSLDPDAILVDDIGIPSADDVYRRASVVFLLDRHRDGSAPVVVLWDQDGVRSVDDVSLSDDDRFGLAGVARVP